MLKSLKHYFFSVAMLMTSVVSAQNIEDIYQQVLQSAPQLQIDSMGVKIGLAREQQAFGALLPQVSIRSSWTESEQLRETFSSNVTESYSGERYSLSVDQSLINMPKYYEWKRSKEVSKQFEFKRKENASLLRLDMIGRYFHLLNAGANLAVSRENRLATEKKREHIRALYKLQRVKVTELFELEAQYDMSMSREIDAMQARDLARGGLGELTNSPIVNISPLKKTGYFMERVEDLDEWTALSVTKNYKLKGLQKIIDAARRNVEKMSSGHYPTLGLQLSKNKSDIGFESASTRPTLTEVATLNLSIPIYSGGTTNARLYEASHQLEIAQLQYELEKRKIIKELKDMFLGVNGMISRVEAANQAVKSAGKSNQAMKRSFELGIATVSEVLDDQYLFSEAKRQHQQALHEYIIAKANLFHLSGKLDEAFIYKINNWLM